MGHFTNTEASSQRKRPNFSNFKSLNSNYITRRINQGKNMSLTQGALLTICQGGTVEDPNLQLLSFKRIAGSSSERYRLLISDGMYSNSYAMLATQLNKMVTDSTLDEFCVIKVKRLQCNTMQGKKVIIILDMEVLRPGSQVGQKIGTLSLLLPMQPSVKMIRKSLGGPAREL